MANLFKVTKTTSTGQKASVFMESETIKTVRGLLQHRLDAIKKMLDFRPGDSITAEIVENTTTDDVKIDAIEIIQVTLDGVQNQSKGILSQDLYDKLYNLRCDIQSELDDLWERKNN